MNIFGALPDWLGTAIIAASFAILGFLGRKLFDMLEEQRTRKANAIKELERVRRLLEESRSVFENQNYLARRLMSLLLSQYGNRVPSEVGYDETFYQMYDLMEGEQSELFNLIRGITLNSMHHLNEELQRWANENSARQLVGKSSPKAKHLDDQLRLLRKHSNVWFDKYESVFKTSERRSLVYLADEKRHGERFPPELSTAVDSLLHELEPRLQRSVMGGRQLQTRPIRTETKDMLQEYSEDIDRLRFLRDAGVIQLHRRREIALNEFASAIDAETNEIMIVCSSLRYLFKEASKEIAIKLRSKIEKGVSVRFLLTHPVVADLRANQEARRLTDIGREIVDSLLTLRKWNVPPENVRLYKGTPTCFAIKTGTRMLLNPYPYGAVTYDSPCIIVETSEDQPGYFYDAFDASHFGAWDTTVAERIVDYDATIRELQSKLATYADLVSKMLET